MIKLEFAHIEEVRGIRKLEINFNNKTYAISGPNGSGKSGVIDAIEFGLTGEIERLAGSGTRGLSVPEHGPHVDKTKFPEAAFVKLRVFLPEIGKSATITRKLKSPKEPTIEPADDDVKAALSEVADHPEITLSRRQIVRFILVEPGQRSKEIQSLLKLDELGQIRSALYTAQNKLQIAHKTAAAQRESCREALRLHLQIPTLSVETILEAINKRRKLLGLAVLAELTDDTMLTSGLLDTAKTSTFNKVSAQSDLRALSDAAKDFSTLAEEENSLIVAEIARLEADATLLKALQRHSFIEDGFDLIDGAECPLCDTDWEDEERLRNHLKEKIEKSNAAQGIRDSLIANGAVIIGHAIRVVDLMAPVHKMAVGEAETEFASLLAAWIVDLENLKINLASVEGLIGEKNRLARVWLNEPAAFAEGLMKLTDKVDAKPDQTAAIDAQTFLVTAQLRLDDGRTASRNEDKANGAWNSAKAAYAAYCDVSEAELGKLYEEVQDDFSEFYRELNEDDESAFTAELASSEGKLDLKVNFYERGLFPPGAYHSEGHQDGMGVCLYLALMKRLFGDGFTFALLDDVVMSVDSGHRYQFCKLLKTRFPDTQFVITTHDRLWAEQMKSAGLVTGKTSMVFHSWTIDTGPLVESNQDIWKEIDTALAKNKVDAGAAALRQHLEYVSRHLADQLGASPRFRADGSYELAELLPSVLVRTKKLHGKAANAAQSWKNDDIMKLIGERKDLLATLANASNVEQWAINKAVHHNAWATFSAADFKPVVAAFKELLGFFRCDKCDSWIYVSPPRGEPELLRCSCNDMSFNLKSKQKSD